MSDKKKTADQISQDINKPVKEPSSTGGNQVKPAMGNTDSGDHRDVEADKQKKKDKNIKPDTMGSRESDKEYSADKEYPENTPGSREAEAVHDLTNLNRLESNQII